MTFVKASDTSVPVARSQGELERILRRYNATDFQMGSNWEKLAARSAVHVLVPGRPALRQAGTARGFRRMTSPASGPVYDGDSDFCSRCHDHTGFELVDGEWLSVCCSARPMPVDVEPRDDDVAWSGGFAKNH